MFKFCELISSIQMDGWEIDVEMFLFMYGYNLYNFYY